MSRGVGEAATRLSDSKLLTSLGGSKLLDFFARIGVSRTGLGSVRAKQVTGEMLVEFCEEDMRDVFEEFKDRFLIRKLLRDPSLYHEHLKAFIPSLEVVTVLSDDSDSEHQEPVRFQSPRVTSTGLHGEESATRSRTSSIENSVIQPIKQHNELASLQRGTVLGAAQKPVGTVRTAPEVPATVQQQQHADWKHVSSMGESLRIPASALAAGFDPSKFGKHLLVQSPASVGSALPSGFRSQGQLGMMGYPTQVQPGAGMLYSPSSNSYPGNWSLAPIAANASATLAGRPPQADAVRLLQTKPATADNGGLPPPASTTATISAPHPSDTFPKRSDSDAMPKSHMNFAPMGPYSLATLSGASQGTQPQSASENQMEAAYNGYALESLQCIQSSIARFSAGELLAKKELRGKPSDAHSASHTIIRQAAQLAGIWRKAPPVKSITLQQKENFLQAVFFAAPQLAEHRALVWQRLIQALQNRRKYLLDRKLGKRRSASGKIISPDGSSSAIQSRLQSQHSQGADVQETSSIMSDTNIQNWTDYDIVELDSDSSRDEFVMNIKEEVTQETEEGH